MKNLLYIYTTIGLLMPMTSFAQAQDNKITVEVQQIDTSRGGNILLMLFSEKGFPKVHDDVLSQYSLPVHRDTNSFTVSVSVPNNIQELAIKILHDEDGSGSVTKNWTGIFPREGLGFSNGAKIRFGPPSFKQAKLHIKDIKNTLSIPIVYP